MFSGQVVLITGAASGIGLGTAKLFVENGATVLGADVQQEALRVAKRQLGDRFMPNVCDVTQEQQIASLSAYVEQTFQRLDVLVNNAGVVKVAIGPEDITEQDFYYHYDVIVKGPMLMVKHFVHLLRRSPNPSIVNISSGAELTEAPLHSLYSTAKTALAKYTRHLVVDLPGIRSNAIVPGWIDTPMARFVGLNDERAESLKKRIPCGRIGQPEDIANCILFLSSEKATYINGASIVIDGGNAIASIDVGTTPKTKSTDAAHESGRARFGRAFDVESHAR